MLLFILVLLDAKMVLIGKVLLDRWMVLLL
jgi:hypothetical protein